VALVLDLTAVVFTVNVADVFPAGIVRHFEMVAEAELLTIKIERPAGARDVIVTVPVPTFRRPSM
jgi:hypothetical protein